MKENCRLQESFGDDRRPVEEAMSRAAPVDVDTAVAADGDGVSATSDDEFDEFLLYLVDEAILSARAYNQMQERLQEWGAQRALFKIGTMAESSAVDSRRTTSASEDLEFDQMANVFGRTVVTDSAMQSPDNATKEPRSSQFVQMFSVAVDESDSGGETRQKRPLEPSSSEERDNPPSKQASIDQAMTTPHSLVDVMFAHVRRADETPASESVADSESPGTPMEIDDQKVCSLLHNFL